MPERLRPAPAGPRRQNAHSALWHARRHRAAPDHGRHPPRHRRRPPQPRSSTTVRSAPSSRPGDRTRRPRSPGSLDGRQPVSEDLALPRDSSRPAPQHRRLQPADATPRLPHHSRPQRRADRPGRTTALPWFSRNSSASTFTRPGNGPPTHNPTGPPTSPNVPAHHLDPDRAAGRSRSPHRIAPDREPVLTRTARSPPRGVPGSPRAWTPGTAAPPTARASSSGTATAAPTRNGT